MTKTEKEIISSWNGDINQPMVSISCITYNHEDYIAEAIESMLMQQTSFPFEILIHDDASTDKTAKIVKKYETAYPNIIKAIYQKENQYSKGIKVGKFNRNRAKGKYYALCEGDDYYTDRKKIQKQTEFMEDNPEYSLCVHSGSIVTYEKELIKYVRPSEFDKEYTTQEIINGGGGLFVTNSMLFRKEFYQELAPFQKASPVGDYPLTIRLSLYGKVKYLDENMSAYRYMLKGSWSEKNSIDVEYRKEHARKIINMFNSLNQYTDYKYKEIINEKIKKLQFDLLMVSGKFKEVKAQEYMAFYEKLSFSQKIKARFKFYFPSLFRILRKINNKITY